ncbi:FAD binding domain-containing protein [Flavobacterium anhuiense]|uniref:FAD binding domain-containing protein n=1 Tax=Flavobacterium anhuiense TaxID=459526 RepID=UPI003D956985
MCGYNRIHAILGQSKNCIAVFPSDICVVLAALDATVNISGPHREGRIMFLEFHRLPGDMPHIDNSLKHGEIITSIDLPAKGFTENYSLLRDIKFEEAAFANGSFISNHNMEAGISIREIFEGIGEKQIKTASTSMPNPLKFGRKARAVHSAVFVEVQMGTSS